MKGSGYGWRYKGTLAGSSLEESNGRKEKVLNRAEGNEQSLSLGAKRIQGKIVEDRTKRNATPECKDEGPSRAGGIKREHWEGEEQTRADIKEIYDLEQECKPRIRKSERGKARIMEETRIVNEAKKVKESRDQAQEAGWSSPNSVVG